MDLAGARSPACLPEVQDTELGPAEVMGTRGEGLTHRSVTVPTPDEWLAGVRAKIERANQHVRDLKSAIQAFRDSDPYGFRIEDDLKSGDKVHRLHIRQETPNSFALLIGDAVHNLRSALDHLAWQLVIANSQVPKSGPGGAQFPIYDPPPIPKPSQGKKQGISADAQKLIEAAKPYKGGNVGLWTIHQLDITDKHKVLLVTAFALSTIMPIWKGSGIWQAFRAPVSSLTPKNGIVDFNMDVFGPYSQRFNIRVPVGIQDDGTLPVI